MELLAQVNGYFLLAMACASLAGVGVASQLAWNDTARGIRLPLIFGLGLAPFIFGLVCVALLAFAPGAPVAFHRTAFVLILAALSLPFVPSLLRGSCFTCPARTPLRASEKLMLALLVIFTLGLLANAILLPLTQNDALEYATVGRILFEARDIAAYPAMQPEQTASGFYGPWTHPPLYVAQIYGMNLLQGHADSPGLMRLISPWCALLATGLVYALGRFINRRAALMAALMFLSTPLFYLGADSALIDALPVLAAALVLCSIVGLDATRRRSAVQQGIVLGLAMWTHSSAILLLPLALAALGSLYGLKRLPAALLHALLAAAVACAVAAWPYLRNLSIFGSLISDNPVVFALPELRWGDYFAYNRGINSTAALIQYGIFKGWFALESYGGIFWVMAVGMFAFLRHQRLRGLGRILRDGAAGLTPGTRLLWICALTLLVYHAGVILSILLGIDLMIRNERYMLMIMPFVALLAGWIIDYMICRWEKHGRLVNAFAAVMIACVLITLTLQFTAFVVYRMKTNGISFSEPLARHTEILRSNPDYRAMDYLHNHTQPNAVVLSMRPAVMYYADRRMISYLDPRLVPFYKADSDREALAVLNDLGIRYVEVTDYALPPLYASRLLPILSDPMAARFRFQSEGYQVFELANSDKIASAPREITKIKGWNSQHRLLIGGRKTLSNHNLKLKEFDPSTYSKTHFPWGLFQRDFSTAIESPLIDVGRLLNEPNANQHRIHIALKGDGAVKFSMQQFDADGKILRTCLMDVMWCEDVLIGNEVLTNNTLRTFTRRVVLLPQTRQWRIAVEHFGNSEVKIESLSVARVSSGR
ncbi:MAG: hypothetical protein DI582_03765 [Azospirillum brasilense]|nr:MAG: hypothetical protein DI582_03765 [Azospirillum brasilense]